MKGNSLCFLLIPTLLFGPLFAESDDQSDETNFYDESGEWGFYFFDDPNYEEIRKQVSKDPESVVEKMEEEKAELKTLLYLAVLDPTKANLIAYIKKQNERILRAEEFSNRWQEVLLNFPELGSMIPTTHSGIQLKKQVEEKEQNKILDSLKQDFFLLLFAKGGDPYGEHAVKVAKMFTSLSGWEMATVSTNELPLQNEPNYFVSPGLAELYKVQNTPSFLIINPETQEGWHVGAGAIAVSDLIENICIQAKAHPQLEKASKKAKKSKKEEKKPYFSPPHTGAIK